MVTRRRGVKHSHNKTRTIIKALLRKTRHKNKKNKNSKTKKRYQSGGGPKAKAKGRKGVRAEFKLIRELIRKGLVPPDTLQKQVIYQKKYNTAEFDLHMDTTGLPYHVSVKSVQKKSEGQNSFTIMCGKSDRFIGQAGFGEVPYHMIVVIRQKHPTDPNKTQHRTLDIDLRSTAGRRLLFGDATDCGIKDIVEQAEVLSSAYCKYPAETKPKIDKFNAYLRSLNAKIQLAPKIGNPDKNRATRTQSSITGFNPSSPTTSSALVNEFFLSSDTNTPDSNPDYKDEYMGNSAEPAASRKSRATSGRTAPGSRGTSSRNTSSRNTSSRKTSSIHGISKQPTPQVSYFRSFKPRVRGTTQLGVIPEEFTPPASALSEGKS
jgi:hypothetical protein